MKLRMSLAILALSPLPALAQSETGTRLGGRPAQVPDNGTNIRRARIWMDAYAACIARRDPKRVAAILDAPIEATPALAALNQGSFDDCLSGGGLADELRMSGRLLRGALYVERVRHLAPGLTLDKIGTTTLPVNPVSGEAAERISLVRFGECLMRRDYANSLALVVARVATAGEDKALAALGPALSGCIDEGSSVKLSKSIIEGAVAEAIYRSVDRPNIVATNSSAD